jgi:hypothetical protein
MAMIALLVGLSLELEARVVMPMVAIGTFKSVMKRPIVHIGLLKPLAHLHCSVAIMGVPVHPLWSEGVICLKFK